MKILYVTTIGATMVFFQSFIEQLLKEGHSVDIAANETEWEVPQHYRNIGCKIHHISTSRSPLNKGNFAAIKEIYDLVKAEKYDVVHCHTPNASVVTRLACKSFRKKGLKVFYTAHGFHFYKGAPRLNWLVYYPIEKFFSKFTDKLITINQEDYNLAKTKFFAKEVFYVPGVGINLTRFENSQVDWNEKRREIGVPEDCFLLLSVGELNKNKNHQVIIRAIARLKNPKVHYAIAGVGDKKEYLLELAKELGIEEQVHLLGYRKDVAELYKASDVYALPSIREGLNASLMEAMASGLPCIASIVRGNVDLINKGGGFLFNPRDFRECAENLGNMIDSDIKYMGIFNQSVIKEYSTENVAGFMRKIYEL